MVTHFSQRQTQFSYFDQLFGGPVWSGSKILDFGGNVGGFLVSAGYRLDHDDYWRLANWCVEVNEKLYFEPGNELCQQERRGKPGESYCSDYTAAYMASLFPGATVLPPVSSESQHCCILKSGAQASLPALRLVAR